ncbi:class I SAM-dependent methyltransferase [Candidatus Latescibacterota bacterium]
MKKKEKKQTPWYEEYFGPDYIVIDEQKNNLKEVKFLLEVLRLKKGSKLLDVGCGYGRHIAPLAKHGVDVTGCDLSPHMLTEAQKKLKKIGKTNKLVRCDMRSLPFGKKFDFACNMFNSFGYFESEDDNFRVLKSISDVLKPGGLFLLDLVNRDFLLRMFNKKDWFEKKGTYTLEKKRFDPITNRSEIDVTVIDKTGKKDYHHSIRVYSFTEISMLLEAAGLEVQAVFGGFSGEKYDWNHDRMLILSQAGNGG